MQFRRRNRHGHRQPNVNDEFGVSLVTLQEGDQAIMTHTTGDLNVVRRLSEMGLTPGSELKVRRKCSFRGPLEIEVRGVALALGYALASEICVQPLEGKTQ
jgi:Fe2+ transport system protein FeoA